MREARLAADAPRFRPPPLARHVSVRGAFVVLGLAVACVLALGLANSNRMGLECDDGSVRAYRGSFVPWARRPLAEPMFPPLAVDEGDCREFPVQSATELEQRYLVLAFRRIDAALQDESPTSLEEAATILASIERFFAGDGEAMDAGVQERRRALVLARLRADVTAGRAAMLRAEQRLKEARELGVEPEILDALERALHHAGVGANAEESSDMPSPGGTEPATGTAVDDRAL